MNKRLRVFLLGATSLAYMVFCIAGYPLVGISVMLPSILLCGFATWLYDYKIGLLISFLSQPYNALAMIYNMDDPQGWRTALEPGGLAAQLLAIFFISVAKKNHAKRLKLTADLEKRIQQRNTELKNITSYMEDRARAEHAKISTQLFNTVANQLVGLLFHSEALRNFLDYADAPQTPSAKKLVHIAKQNIEQVENLAGKLAPQRIMEYGIENALRRMCAYFTKVAGTHFTITVSDPSENISEKTQFNLYRIAHETVTNALRHAKATHIELSLTLTENAYVLKVLNNGNPLPVSPQEGLGMRLVQQRAEAMQATARFESTNHGQTLFVCTVPLRK